MLAISVLGVVPTAATPPSASSRLAYESNQGAAGTYEICVGASTCLTSNSRDDRDPDWSPNGSKIAFGSDRDGNHEIYVMNANGSVPTRLTTSPGTDSHPTWSPDGSKIAFRTFRDGNSEIYVMNAIDGSGPLRLTNNPAEDANPTWSPDGTKIAFFSAGDICVMDASDGSSAVCLTSDQTNSGPAWSPDGTKIAFSSIRDGNPEIYVMSAADGGGVIRLTDNPANDGGPAWSQNGSEIFFQTDRDGDFEIFSMPAAGGSEPIQQTINTFTDLDPHWQPLIDSDLDGCTDNRELVVKPNSETSGGQRNPNYFWDFYDVWTRPDPVGQPTLWTRDKFVNAGGDVLSVARRYGASRPGGAPTKQQALTEALTPPTSDTGYHASFDRGPFIGPNIWNIGPPDGYIAASPDVLGVARQFGHSCL